MRYMQTYLPYEKITCAYCGRTPDKCHRFGNWTNCDVPNPSITPVPCPDCAGTMAKHTRVSCND